MNPTPNKCYDGPIPRILASQEFIENNCFRLAKTQEEISQRLKLENGVFSFAHEILLPYLEWSHAKSFYPAEFQAEVDAGTKSAPVLISSLQETVQDALDYLVFGFGKALNERGLSASRTIDKLKHWMWLLGRADLSELVSDENTYNPYGMPSLINLAEALGLKECITDELRFFAERRV